MRFLALLRKELRECLPWMLLAAIFLLVFGGLGLWQEIIPQNIEYRHPVFSPFSNVDYYKLTQHSLLSTAGAFVFLTSIGLGLALGVRQFWMAGFTRTWGFTLHRSVRRITLLWAKFAAAVITFLSSLAFIWTLFYLYASSPRVFPVPPTIRVFIEGWAFIAIGIVVYLGTALAGMSRAKWYTTKMLSLAFAILILATVTVQWKLAWAFAAIIVGVVILLSQIIDTFLNREF